MIVRLVVPSLAALAVTGCAAPTAPSPAAPPASGIASAATCAALVGARGWADPKLRIVQADFRPGGERVAIGDGPAATTSPPLPAHCEVNGILHERRGQNGQDYAIRFRMRLPVAWNRRFLFQGGGGTNGVVGDATGSISPGAAPALTEGYAVVAQDSGHWNVLNAPPSAGGVVAFGRDPQARADYGHASLKASYDAAREIIARVYGGAPAYSYFAGCSKGGQEGMAFAQRYPQAFDGILAAAPGFSLPRAAVAEAWNTQAFAAAIPLAGGSPTLAQLAASFSDADLQLARNAVLAACDAEDGLRDGLVGAFRQCTAAKVLPQLRARQCAGGKQPGCLADAQITALARAYAGPRNAAGQQLYPAFPWDAGMADAGWRIWKIGIAAPDGGVAVPSLNAAMGAPALATIFSTPPRALGGTPDAGLAFALAYDFDRDPPAIYATVPGFPRSAWEDIGMRSPDLRGFVRRGARMIVPHGVSDPVFSITDTIDWWEEVDRRNGGRAASFVRVFPVPGMAHCSGGPATDRYDAFAALVRWVEKGEAPDRIEAAASDRSPWPGRTRPLCPYPAIARPVPGGDPERATGFACVR